MEQVIYICGVCGKVFLKQKKCDYCGNNPLSKCRFEESSHYIVENYETGKKRYKMTYKFVEVRGKPIPNK